MERLRNLNLDMAMYQGGLVKTALGDDHSNEKTEGETHFYNQNKLTSGVQLKNDETATNYDTIPPIRVVNWREQTPGYSLVVGATVQGVPIEAVVDSGAQVSVIQHTWMKRCLPTICMVERVELKGAATSSNMGANRSEDISIVVGRSQYINSMFVADISDDAILGLDWMRANKVAIDFEHGLISVGGETIAARYKQGRAGLVPLSEARTIKRTLLKPNALQQVVVRAPRINQGEWMLQECVSVMGVFVPNLVVQGGDQVSIWVLNGTDNSVTLRRGCILGVLQPVTVLNHDKTALHIDDTLQINKIMVGGITSSGLPEHLIDMCTEAQKDLTTEQSQILEHILIKHQSAFAKGDFDLGTFSAVRHKINTGDAVPIRQRMRRTPLGYELEEEQHLRKLLEANVIEPSDSEWASPSVLVRKKDGSVRWCIDMRKLNAVTVKDSFPLPLIEECVDSLDGCAYFSTLDMASGYYQLEVGEVDRHKTAFVTKYGLYQFRRMPFGLCNAPATFSRAVSLVLRGLSWSRVIAFLDDILVLGKTFEEHVGNLSEVLERFVNYGMKLKPKKCKLLKNSVLFLGKVVSKSGVEVNPANIDRILEWPIPSSKKEVEAFIGLVNYHREHIIGFAGIAEPLYKLKKKTLFKWGEEHTHSFEKLKQAMTTTPVLAYPNAKDPFILDTDASYHSIGAELLQVQGGIERVIGYDSLALDPAQRKYCTTRKELLAVVLFTRRFRMYLMGRTFHVRTDHNSLVWLMGFKNIEGQLARWLEELASYNMTIMHRPGKEHSNADGLSRIPNPTDVCTGVNDISKLPCNQGSVECRYCSRMNSQWDRFGDDVDYVVPLGIRKISLVEVDNVPVPKPSDVERWLVRHSFQDVAQLQQEDEGLTDVIHWLKDDKLPSQAELALLSPAAKHWWSLKKQLSLIRGVLYYHDICTEPERTILVAPKSIQQLILENCHDTPLSGHMGRAKTLISVKRYATWYRINEGVINYVKGCTVCNKQKNGGRKAKSGQVSYHAGSPLERVHIDILGPLTETPNGSKYILVMVDQFTKWVECCALSDQTAETVATSFIDNIVLRFGCPLELHSDQGRNFVGKVFQEVCRLLEITKTRTTPYRPQANGQVERFNRTIMQIIRCFIKQKYNDWDKYLPLAASAIRATVNRNTGYTPNYLMLGREVLRPLDLMLPSIKDDQSPGSVAGYVEKYQEAFQQAHEIARVNLKQTQRRQKQDYDVKLKHAMYKVGDIVMRIRDAAIVGVTRKLQSPWTGPWVVEEVLSPVLIRIRGRKKSVVVHHDKLKPSADRQFSIWLMRLRNAILNRTDLDEVIDENEDNRQEKNEPLGLDLLYGDHHGNAYDKEDLDQPEETEETSEVISVELPQQSVRDLKEHGVVTRGGRVSKESGWYNSFVRH